MAKGGENMKLLKKVLQIGLLALFVLVTIPNPAYATGEAQVFHLTGNFQTLALTCPPPDDDEQCVIDQLSGGLVGTNKLVTTGFTETDQFIFYQDTTTIISQYGEFQGEERGVINKETGAFHSRGTLTSVDGCGSKIKIRNNGVIDLETLEDEGTYKATLLLKQCD
jgi:hypothetical protein